MENADAKAFFKSKETQVGKMLYTHPSKSCGNIGLGDNYVPILSSIDKWISKNI